MSLDFSGLQAQVDALNTNVTAIQNEIAELKAATDETANQAAINNITSALTSANSALNALVPPPALASAPTESAPQ